MTPPPSIGIRCVLGSVLLTLVSCGDPGPAADPELERMRQDLIASHRERLKEPLPADLRAKLERQIERLERGESALDEEESLRLAGYSVTETTASQVYRNPAHGYEVTLPAGIELQEHRNGQFVIVPEHGSLFGIWIHADETVEGVEAKLLSDFERWCSQHPDSAKARAENGGALRLVAITQGPFKGYKAVAKEQPDDAPARFLAFRSPRLDGYFGFNLTPSLTSVLFESLRPITAAPPGK